MSDCKMKKYLRENKDSEKCENCGESLPHKYRGCVVKREQRDSEKCEKCGDTLPHKYRGCISKREHD